MAHDPGVAVDVTALVGGAVGGAAIQSVLGSLFGQVHERREFRARTLNSVAAVERERWASGQDREPFRAAISDLRSRGLVAGTNRELLDAYVLGAAACFGTSLTNWERSGGDPEGGSIGIPLSEYVVACREALIFSLWHPRWALVIRFAVRKILAVRKARLTRQAEKETSRSTGIASGSLAKPAPSVGRRGLDEAQAGIAPAKISFSWSASKG